MSDCILVTGGAGYVGSHTLVELVEAGYNVVALDNLVNSSMDGISRVSEITGKTIPAHSVNLLDKEALQDLFSKSINRVSEITGKTIPMHVVDILDKKGLQDLFSKYKFTCVMHFAGLKAVGESCEKPLLYYKNNVGGTTTLLEVMQEYGVYNMIFSSSATVYGDPKKLPIDENHPTGGCTNPYGKTKYFIEEILKDLCAADENWNAVLLRYFNPVGAHVSGKIGEDPQGIPNNLMPYISQVAVGRLKELAVYGNDYDTPDGTGVRDYIHVVDLAQGHVSALKKIQEKCGCKIYNLGTGKGYSVIEMAKAFEKASGKPVPYKIAGRRAGDIASCYADASLAEKELGWTAKLDLARMCEDLWRWQSTNPTGFKKA